MGPALRPGNGTTVTLKTQLNQRQLARGRDLHPGQAQVVYLIPRGGLDRGDDRFPAKRDAAAAERFLAKGSKANVVAS
jgi:hypothetical protein